MQAIRVTAAAFVTCMGVFFVMLVQLQVVSGAAYYQEAQRSIATVELVPAARGKLLDCDGKILAEDLTVWTAQLDENCPADVKQRLRTLCREEDVSWDGGTSIPEPTPRLLARIQEESLEGVSMFPTVRRVGSGDRAPHLLGRVAAMDETEWTHYEEVGYAMNERVGKDGAERAFEDRLHGTPGKRVVERNREGQVTSTQYSILPQAGENVSLTLSLDLQTVASDALQHFLDENPKAVGGAVAVLDVKTGGVLALVSLPGYDTETFSQDYSTLVKDPARPLLNRAVQGTYAPGSTFKMVTAMAALEEGYLTPETQILDTGRYTYYKNPQPQCWLYRQEKRTHGLETVSEAIEDSCNVFFYDAGRRVGIETLGDYARLLGLGERTGIELEGEQQGVVAGPSYTESLGGTWYEGSVLSAAIGQENNRFTPLQLAEMVSTLVGDGTRRRVHIEEGAEGTLGTLSFSPENVDAVKQGMLAVTKQGSLRRVFRSVPVPVGAKTGSAQVEGKDQSNAVLVCFAPYEEPEIALALVAEEGGSGAGLGSVAAEILTSYFSDTDDK